MIAAVTACLRFLEPRKIVVLCVCGALILGCGLVSLRLAAREDIRVLIPDGSSHLAEQFAFMRDAPFLHTLRITVGGGGSAPRVLADSLAGALESPEIPFIAKGPGAFTARDLPRLLDIIPALLSPEQIAAFGNALNADAIREALRRSRRLLLGPSGPALRGLVAQDPLGLHAAFLGSLASTPGMRGIPAKEGYFTDASGAYCMLVAKPAAAMTDATTSAAVMARVRKAVSALPPETEILVTGSYRHSEANAAIIRADLGRVLPVSLLLIAGLFLVFLRNARALTILPVPLAALCVAGAVTAACYGAVSGIVLGFGSVVLGITADYAIHAYYAVTRAASAERGVAGLCPPLLAGACTTACAFASLLFSGVPAIRQLGVFGLVGIGTALFISLLVLPLVLRPDGGDAAAYCPARPVRAKFLFMTVLLASLGLVIVSASLILRFDGDIRNLSWRAPEIVRDDVRSDAIWNSPQEGTFVVTAADGTDAGFEQALRRNERVRELLARAGITGFGMAAFLPSQERQAQSRAAWKALWAGRKDTILAEVDAAAPEFGFAPGAFAPFRAWIANEPPEVGPETLHNLGLGFFPAMLAGRTAERSLLYTILPANAVPDAALLRDLREAGARHVSGTGFRAGMAEVVGGDIFRFCLLTVIAAAAAVIFMFRAPPRCAAVLLPVLAGLAFTLSLFYVTGIAVNMFHAMALPLVMALSVDYGIFMQAVIEGRIGRDGVKGVLLSALTTLAGFGSLLLARHPALFSLGLAVTGGIAAACAAAVWVQPRLFTGQGET